MTRSLRNRRDFARIYAEGEKRIGRLLVLYILSAEDNAQAVVASRKIGNAVRRNRAKRLLREALRALGGGEARFAPWRAERDSRATSGSWVVLVARRAIVSVGLREVLDELDQLLRGSARA